MTTFRKGVQLNLQIPSKKSDNVSRTKTKSTTDRRCRQQRKIQFKHLVLSEEPLNGCQTVWWNQQPSHHFNCSCNNSNNNSNNSNGNNNNNNNNSGGNNPSNSNNSSNSSSSSSSSGLTGQVYFARHLDLIFAVKKIDVSRKSSVHTPDKILNIFKAVYNPAPVSKWKRRNKHHYKHCCCSHGDGGCGGTDKNTNTNTSNTTTTTTNNNNNSSSSSSSSSSNASSNGGTSSRKSLICNNDKFCEETDRENVITLHKLFYKYGTVYAVLDYMNAGSLSDVIQLLRRERYMIPENVLSSITYQVLCGLCKLQARHVNMMDRHDKSPSQARRNRRRTVRSSYESNNNRVDSSSSSNSCNSTTSSSGSYCGDSSSSNGSPNPYESYTSNVNGIPWEQQEDEEEAEAEDEDQLLVTTTETPEDDHLLHLQYACGGTSTIGHGNLKTSNILLDSNGSVKLQDSGARIIRQIFNINEHSTQKTSSDVTYFQNEYGYLAPEILRGNSFSRSSDIWSLGIILVECCKKDFPIMFIGNTAFSKIIHFTNSVQDDCHLQIMAESTCCYSSALTDFISSCLRKNPEERPTAETLLQHEFITRYSSDLPTARKTVRSYLLTFVHPPSETFGPLYGSAWKRKHLVDVIIHTRE